MTALNLTETKAEIVTDQFIGGNWVQGENNDSVDIIDPFNNSSVCAVNPATIEQVNSAIETAHATYKDPSWRDLLDRERGTLLYRLAELLRRDIEIFAAAKISMSRRSNSASRYKRVPRSRSKRSRHEGSL